MSSQGVCSSRCSPATPFENENLEQLFALRLVLVLFCFFDNFFFVFLRTFSFFLFFTLSRENVVESTCAEVRDGQGKQEEGNVISITSVNERLATRATEWYPACSGVSASCSVPVTQRRCRH